MNYEYLAQKTIEVCKFFSTNRKAEDMLEVFPSTKSSIWFTKRLEEYPHYEEDKLKWRIIMQLELLYFEDKKVFEEYESNINDLYEHIH